MDKKIKVLIFPAGSEIAIEIFHSLKYNLHVELFGASGKSDHAGFLYDSTHYFEGNFYVDQPDFLERFNRLLDQNSIDIVFPTHDTIALHLAEHGDKLHARVLTSPLETARIAREKKLIYTLFEDTGFCPRVYAPPYGDASFPLFLKPNIGEGGKRTHLAETREALEYFLSLNSSLMVCEYLPGEELSVDCFTDRHGQLRFAGPRTRERVQIGISFRSASAALTDEIEAIAKTINERVKIRGAWFFQVKKDAAGTFKLLEFAVRQASTMGLYRQVGVNFALLSIFDAMDIDVRILRNHYDIVLDRCLYNRYRADFSYQCVYLDFDDTLVVDNSVNTVAIRFVYYCRQKNIPVVLLTKHKYDIAETLRALCHSHRSVQRDCFDRRTWRQGGPHPEQELHIYRQFLS